MTVSTVKTKIILQGNDLTRNWVYDFPVDDVSDLKIYVTNASGIINLITANYTIDLNTQTVTYPTVASGLPLLPTGWKITIAREIDLVQTSVYANQGKFPSETIEDSLDNLTLIAQQQQEQIDRCLKIPIDNAQVTNWSETETYIIGDAVNVGGLIFISKTNSNTNNYPVGDLVNWETVQYGIIHTHDGVDSPTLSRRAFGLGLNLGNIAIGTDSLLRTDTGIYECIGIGEGAGSNVRGGGAFGVISLGAYALSGRNVFGNYIDNTGSENIGIGDWALSIIGSGKRNVAIGSNAGYNTDTGARLENADNCILIGYKAMPPSATASNQIRIGNTDITYAGIQVSWTTTSDQRYKENIKPLEVGLEFINKLKPVEYNRISNDKKEKEFGLIAQDVEKLLNDENLERVGLLSKDDKGYMSIRYNDLIAPIIKSIQELTKENKKLKSRILKLEKSIKK